MLYAAISSELSPPAWYIGHRFGNSPKLPSGLWKYRKACIKIPAHFPYFAWPQYGVLNRQIIQSKLNTRITT
jgi:hypothetical protein